MALAALEATPARVTVHEEGSGTRGRLVICLWTPQPTTRPPRRPADRHLRSRRRRPADLGDRPAATSGARTACRPRGSHWLPRSELLTFEEIDHGSLGVFVGLGVRSLKVTGGEPTVRADLPNLIRMFRRGRPGARHLHHDERPPPRPAGRAAGGGRRRPRDRLVRLAASPPVRRDDAARRASIESSRGLARGRGGRAHAHQDQHRRDRRDRTTTRSSTSRAGRADTGYEVRFIEYMPLGRRACMGAVEGRPGGAGSSRRSTDRVPLKARTAASSRRRPTGSPTGAGRGRRDRER